MIVEKSNIKLKVTKLKSKNAVVTGIAAFLYKL